MSDHARNREGDRCDRIAGRHRHTADRYRGGIGVILFFVGAIITHIRAGWYSFGCPATYLVLAFGALVLGLTQI